MELTMELKEKSITPDYLKNLKEDIADCYRNGNTIAAYLKNELGIVDVMKSGFPDLKDKDNEDFDFSRVRGNTRLMQGKITTYKEAQGMLDKVFNFQMPVVVIPTI